MSNFQKIADAISPLAPAEPAMGENEFHAHTFRKHKGKYYIYKGHYKAAGEGYNSYNEMLPEYLKLVAKKKS